MQPRQFILDFDGERIVGENPFAVFEAKNGACSWNQLPRLLWNVRLGTKEPIYGDAFEQIENLINFARRRGFSVGGAIGFISYDFARSLEPRAFGISPPDDLQIPDMRFTFFSNLKRQKIQQTVDSNKQPISGNQQPASSNYFASVQKIQDYIAAGDIYQANLTRRFEMPLPCTPTQLYEKLIAQNPAPFSALLKWDDLAIVSNSPERFVRLRGRDILAQPIKGTIKRGKTAFEDEKLKIELQNSDKNRAENVMIVDLVRNDLGRVCDFGSVRVPKLCEVQTFPTLHHLVSDVTGTLRVDCDGFDLLRACFPCGSITGAPKIRSMQIIDELEPVRRGAAMGAIGWIDFQGNMDWNVAIRTIICKNNTAYFHVGGGIVADSEAHSEHDEVMLKAQALQAALQL